MTAIYIIYMSLSLSDLVIYVCSECDNEFYLYDLPLDINEPHFCPFCGVRFNHHIEIN